MLKDGFVSINGIPTHVVTWGGWIENGLNDHQEVVVLITGNPGLTGFYYDFLETLHFQLDIPVWVVSHAGHELPPQGKIPKLKTNIELYNLKGQTEHKVAFLNTYIPKDVKVHLIGHSIGCKIILDALKNELVNCKIIKCYFLFPTIERMSTSPNGEFFTGSIVQYSIPVLIFLSWIFTFLPRFLQRILVYCYLMVTGWRNDLDQVITQLVNPKILRRIFFLANEEMKLVTTLDHFAIEKFSEKLYIYYGANDGWTPVEYCKELKLKHPSVQAAVCSKGFDHAFVLRSSKDVGNMVSEWIKCGK